jgi:acetyltransferase-like isoleucine patch superfamily enzyme
MRLRAFLCELLLYVCNHVVGSLPSRRLRMLFYRRVMGFEIGQKTTVFLNCRFDCAKKLTIGASTVVNRGCRLDNRGGLTIGINVSISEEVCILTADHDPRLASFAGRTRPIVIEDFVFIGTRAMILPGVTLKRGSVVGAGAIVTRDVQPFAIVAGSPARAIAKRNPELRYQVEYSRIFH